MWKKELVQRLSSPGTKDARRGSGSCLGEAEAGLGVADSQPFQVSASWRQRVEVEQQGGLGMKGRRMKPVWLLIFIVNLTGCRITIET